MLGYVLKRLLTGAATLLIVFSTIFVVARVIPGDPAQVILGEQATPQALAALRVTLDLDAPLGVQYVRFLAGIFTGDLGVSLISGKPVLQEIARALPSTIELTVVGMFLGVLAGIPLGVLAASRFGSWYDGAVRVLTLAGISFPAFISGILLLLVFAISLGWFPVITIQDSADPLGRLRNLALPALNIGLIMTAYVTRATRAALLTVMSEDYMRTARAKGLRRGQAIWRHGLRNAMIPIVTIVGLYLGTMMGNSVLTEIVFTRPGLGRLILGAIDQRDYTMLNGLMVVFASLVIAANILTDLVYGAFDPRVKYR